MDLSSITSVEDLLRQHKEATKTPHDTIMDMLEDENVSPKEAYKVMVSIAEKLASWHFAIGEDLISSGDEDAVDTGKAWFYDGARLDAIISSMKNIKVVVPWEKEEGEDQ